jgi:hypothetical protein
MTSGPSGPDTGLLGALVRLEPEKTVIAALWAAWLAYVVRVVSRR